MVVGIGSWSSPTRSKGEDEYLEKEILDEEKKSVKRALSPAEAVSQRIALGCKIMALIMVTAASVAHTVRIVTGVHSK